MNFRRFKPVSALFSLCVVSGCGTTVPQIQEIVDSPSSDLPTVSAGGALEFHIKEKVYCEIADAIRQNTTLLPNNFGVQLTLDLQVDETGALNPGVSFITPMHTGVTNFVGFPFVSSPQSYSLGLGGTLSSQATREDKFANYWDVEKLKRNLVGDTCPKTPEHGSSFLLESDLGINQWLHDHLIPEILYPSSQLDKNEDPAFKQDILSYHVKFIVISSGSVTPTWKLVRIATNNGAIPLASANRTRTHDLLITFGPTCKPGMTCVAANSHLAQDVGLAVSNSIRTLTSP